MYVWWHSAGAGWATAASQYLNLFWGLILVRALLFANKSASDESLTARQIFKLKEFKTIFSLNRDLLLRTWALITTFALFSNFSSSLGTMVLATNTLLLQVISVAAYFIDGIAFATESIVGNVKGAGNQQQLPLILKLAGVSSLLMGISIAVLFALFPQALFGLLTNHQSVITQIQNYVWWLLPTLAFGSIAYMLDGYFLGLTAGNMLRNSAIIAFFIGFLPLAMIALRLGNIQLLWLALCCFMATRAITLGLKVSSNHL